MFDLYHTDAQKRYDGPDELKLVADFIPHIGEFVLLFSKLERHVTWAIESMLGASRWEGNELEGMVQNFSSRIKFLDICARPKTGTRQQADERQDIIDRIKSANALRNKLLHNSATGISISSTEIALMLKRLDKDNGKERSIQIGLRELRSEIGALVAVTEDLRRWVHSLCPDAEKRVP